MEKKWIFPFQILLGTSAAISLVIGLCILFATENITIVNALLMLYGVIGVYIAAAND